MVRLRTLTLVLLVVATAAGCSSEKKDKAATATTAATTAPAPTGPQSYTAVIDGPSTLGTENLVYGSFFPKNLAVRPGDTVVFENRGSNDIHTVTFGVKSDRSDAPPLVTKAGQP
ncbi:MAG TPA: hypothetical protein VHL53_14610, partial [Acidimicrobiia bacterium]|nr:hypothetical protein [Acidimicrobiia bacterium]